MTKSTKPAEPENDTQKEAAQSILDFGSAMTATPHGNIYCLTSVKNMENVKKNISTPIITAIFPKIKMELPN